MPADKYNAPALRHGIRMIEILAEAKHSLSLSEIARRMDTNKNMATRLLVTLQDVGWVAAEMPGPKYRLTLTPFTVTSKPVTRLTLRELARQPLHDLWEATGESVYLGILHGDRVLYLEHFDATGPVRIAGQIGGLYPLHCSAPGKVLLSHAGPALLERLLQSGLEQRTEKTLCRKAELLAEMEHIRAVGYAVDNEEYGRGLLCIAAPVFDADGVVIGTIGSSTTTISHANLDAFMACCGSQILETAELISSQLGFSKQATQ